MREFTSVMEQFSDSFGWDFEEAYGASDHSHRVRMGYMKEFDEDAYSDGDLWCDANMLVFLLLFWSKFKRGKQAKSDVKSSKRKQTQAKTKAKASQNKQKQRREQGESKQAQAKTEVRQQAKANKTKERASKHKQ